MSTARKQHQGALPAAVGYMLTCCGLPARRAVAGSKPRLNYVDCGGAVLLTSSGGLSPALLPDAMHPSADGFEALFSQCWDSIIDGLLSSRREGV